MEKDNDCSKDIIYLKFLTGAIKYQCGRCKKAYEYKSTLKRHLTYECGVEKMFQCPQCFARFRRKGHLKSHVFNVHQ